MKRSSSQKRQRSSSRKHSESQKQLNTSKLRETMNSSKLSTKKPIVKCNSSASLRNSQLRASTESIDSQEFFKPSAREAVMTDVEEKDDMRRPQDHAEYNSHTNFL